MESWALWYYQLELLMNHWLLRVAAPVQYVYYSTNANSVFECQGHLTEEPKYLMINFLLHVPSLPLSVNHLSLACIFPMVNNEKKKA